MSYTMTAQGYLGCFNVSTFKQVCTHSLWNVFRHLKFIFSCLPSMYYIRGQQIFLHRAFSRTKIFQVVWVIESLLQHLISLLSYKNSHRQHLNKYSWSCPQNINLEKLLGDHIWPARHSLLTSDLYLEYYVIHVIYIHLLNYQLHAMLCVACNKEKHVG